MDDLEKKFCQKGTSEIETNGTEIEGYASLFGIADKGGDVVTAGAYRVSLDRMRASGGSVKMLWQHDPAQPIGVWDVIREDERGLYVKGRLLTEIERGREAAALLQAGVIDGLSIGYKTVRAERGEKGRRLLKELELWEVSLVTFPMLPEARIGAKHQEDASGFLSELAELFETARQSLSQAQP